MSTPIMQIENLVEGKIISRPSKICRSPYVADVMLETGEQLVAHAPSLGCCGYVDANQSVLLAPHDKPRTCSHVIHLAKRNEKNENYLIGVHPKIAEKIVKRSLEIGCIETLENLSNIKSGQRFLNSRFDFICKDKNGIQTIIEVKNVPSADYEDILTKERKKRDYSNRDIDSKIAYFPDGYRKKSTDTISPRALEYIQELEKLKVENENIRCIIIFVVQRGDCKVFQGSTIDPIYKDALNQAYKMGVEVIPVRFVWNENGICEYTGIMEFKL